MVSFKTIVNLSALLLALILGAIYHPLIVTLFLLLFSKSFREWLIGLALRLLYPNLAPRLALGENYVYDEKNRVMHRFYAAEPLYDISRMTGEQYVDLNEEFIERLNLSSNEAFAFIRIGNDKYVRLSRIVKGEGDLGEFSEWLRDRESLLMQYFIIRPLEGGDLTRLVGFPTEPGKVRLIIFLALVSFMLLAVFGLWGLAPAVGLAYFSVRELGNYSVIRGGALEGLKMRLVNSAKLFTMPSDGDLRSIASANANVLRNYALIISGNPDFRATIHALVAREYNKFVVQERGKSLSAVSKWRIAMDRLDQNAEIPIKVMIASDRPLADVNMVMRWSGDLMHLWEFPRINELSRDVTIIPIFHGGRLVVEHSRARVRLGRDREGNELEVDLDALPSGHMLIVGPTGMGKTWTVSTILYRLMNSGIRVMIIDPHGEYLRIPNIEPVDIRRRFFNFFELNGVTKNERIKRLMGELSILGIRSDAVLPFLKELYDKGYYKDLFRSMKYLVDYVDDPTASFTFERILEYLEHAEIVPVSELLDNKALLFSPVRSSPDMMSFLMGVTADHVYTHVMSMNIGERLQQLLVIDEAYYVLNSPLAELLARGVRKFGLGTVFITQTLTGVSNDVLQNIPLIIVLGGNDAYVKAIAQELQLTSEDVRWLTTALPPHMRGLTTKALVINGPIKRLGAIELEPSLKGIMRRLA